MSPRFRILLSCPEIYAQCHCGQRSNKQNTAGLCPMVPSLSRKAPPFENPASSQHRWWHYQAMLRSILSNRLPDPLTGTVAEQSVAFA